MPSTDDNSTQPKHAKSEASIGAKKRSVVVLAVVLVVLLCIGGAGAGYMLWQQHMLDEAAQKQAETPEPDTTTTDETETEEEAEVLPENPIDFDALSSQNADIYAWLYIPNTGVNLAIVQSATDDNYYLDHDVDGNYSIAGAAFTQSMNSKDFSDPVTLIYGHQTSSDSMFTTLHYFENTDFFNANSVMYIYTPGHILTYEIIAAYQYDDRHILNSYDFSDPDVVVSYFQTVLSPTSMLVNVREGATLSADDKIVQLSTCMDAVNRDGTRYLVTGVLVDDQPTQ